jgi:two-component system nitrogen regulation sensor histidine kinase NtrY
VRRRLTDEDLGRLARTVGADLTLYDGPWAVVSSQDDLYKAGLITPVLPARASQAVLSGGSRRYVQADPREGLVVAAGYAPVGGPGGVRRGVLAASLFARATESAQERQRTDLFLFGLSSLAFLLAVTVGLWAAGRIAEPLRSLAAAARRIGAGELSLRMPGGGRDEIGQLIGAFNRMASDLQSTQASLAARRAFLEAMLGNLSAGVLVLDESRAVREMNAAGRRLLSGCEPEMLARIRELGPPAEVASTEVALRGETGPRTLRLIVTPIALEGGTRGWLALFDDVTELLATRQLALYAEMARQVAHEVKNPLTPILLAAQMVRQACADRHPDLQEIVDDNVRQIETQVQRLRWIASEFSLLGRSQLPAAEPVGVAELLRQVRALYPSPDGSLELRCEAPEDLVALASREALLKVLTNLVENAMQAMGGQGRIVLGATARGDRVELRVEDEGPGIPQDVQDRLFEPYFSTKSTGTGLGLVICRNLMEKMGGAIRLQSRADARGAMALLDLPGSRARDL